MQAKSLTLVLAIEVIQGRVEYRTEGEQPEPSGWPGVDANPTVLQEAGVSEL